MGDPTKRVLFVNSEIFPYLTESEIANKGNNYYNYMMMSAYASQSNSSSTIKTTELDKDRFYSCKLYGPSSTEKKPTMTITYSFLTE